METGEENIVHDAYGIVTYNKDSAYFEMTSYSAIRGKMVIEMREISPKIIE